MQIKREQFTQAAEAGVISADQAEALWRFLGTASADTLAFRPAHILYYLGGLIAISDVSFFVILAWDTRAGWPMLGLATAFAILGVALTHYFLYRKQLPIPAGIMITFTVAITPLAVYSLQRALGLWEGDFRSVDFHRYIDWRWIFMELATLAAAAIASENAVENSSSSLLLELLLPPPSSLSRGRLMIVRTRRKVTATSRKMMARRS